MKRYGLFAVLAVAGLAFAVESAEADKRRWKPRLRVGVNLNLGNRHVRRYSSGRYEWRQNRVWIPGQHEVQWVEKRHPDRWEYRTVKVRRPDRTEMRPERVWVPARTTYRSERYVIRPGRWEVRFDPCSYPPRKRVWIPPTYGQRSVPVHEPGRWETRKKAVRIPGGFTTKQERVRIPGGTYRAQERVWRPGHYEYRNVKVWVPGVACAPRNSLVIGGNHGGFGFSLRLSGR
jgi:hypothetical protein